MFFFFGHPLLFCLNNSDERKIILFLNEGCRFLDTVSDMKKSKRSSNALDSNGYDVKEQNFRVL